MGTKEGAIFGGNGLNVLRAMGDPLLFDSANNLNLGVANQWVDLFDLSPAGLKQKDRVFIGIQIYNPDTSNAVYIAFPQVRGTEVPSMKINPGSVADIDELTFGPGAGWQNKYCFYVRAMMKAANGAAASGTLTFAANPATNTTVSVGGIIYTFVAGGGQQIGSVYPVTLGTTLAATLTNLAAAIAAADPRFTASSTGTVTTVSSVYTGTAPNAYALSAGTSGATASGATLSGGTAGNKVDSFIW